MLVKRRNPVASGRPDGFPDPGFWQGRKVLLTGHTGFKGSWMLEWLEALGADVTGMSLAPEGPVSLFEGLHDPARLKRETVDVRDEAQLTALARLLRCLKLPVGEASRQMSFQCYLSFQCYISPQSSEREQNWNEISKLFDFFL